MDKLQYWIEEILPNDSRYIFHLGLLIFVLVISIVFLKTKKKSTTTATTTSETNAKKINKSNASSSATSLQSQQELKSVFDFNKSNNITGNKKNTSEQSQFRSSSYYYAHNNPKSKGGYKDGLRMEDYQMETPRLLSKSGGIDSGSGYNTKENDRSENNGDDTQSMNKSSSNTTNTGSTNSKSSIRYIPIQKYLWDDSQDSTKIIIDSLPSSLSDSKKEFISWHYLSIPKDCIQVKKLIDDEQSQNNGLLIKITKRKSNEKEVECIYYLHIKQLYGKIKDNDSDVGIKVIWKTKRLIIKLFKQSIESWPSLASKSSKGGVGGKASTSSMEEIDEDVFRSFGGN